jgi:hypothetical protein
VSDERLQSGDTLRVLRRAQTILLSMPSRAPSFSIIASRAPFRLTSESRHREGHLKPHEEHVKIVRVVAQSTLDQLDVEKCLTRGEELGVEGRMHNKRSSQRKKTGPTSGIG